MLKNIPPSSRPNSSPSLPRWDTATTSFWSIATTRRIDRCRDGHGHLRPAVGRRHTEAARAILSLLPLDSYVDAPVRLMAVVGDPDAVPEVHSEMQAVVNEAEGKDITIERVERFAFYDAAKSAYAVVRTSEARPHGCFIFKKGVIFD